MVVGFGLGLYPTLPSLCPVEVLIPTLSNERRQRDTVMRMAPGANWTSPPALLLQIQLLFYWSGLCWKYVQQELPK